MIEIIRDGVVVARKAHRCYDCRRTIGAGQRYYRQVLKYDGVYSLASHEDCHAFSNEIVSDGYAPDYDYGVPPLWEMLEGSGDIQSELAAWRGFYPHVVCRIELTRQLAGVDDAPCAVADLGA